MQFCSSVSHRIWLLFNRYSSNPLFLYIFFLSPPPSIVERRYQFRTHFALINRLGDEKKSIRWVRISPTVTHKPFREISLFPNAISKTAEQENTFSSCIYYTTKRTSFIVLVQWDKKKPYCWPHKTFEYKLGI